MRNPRKHYTGKSIGEKELYLKGLRRQAVIPATYIEEEDISTDSTQKVDEFDTQDSSYGKRQYNPKTKTESFFDFLKNNFLQIAMTVIGTVVAAIIILLSINLNREVGELSQQFKYNDKTINELKNDLNDLESSLKEINNQKVEIEIIKERIKYLSERK